MSVRAQGSAIGQLIGTYRINYRDNAAGCLPPSWPNPGPTDGNPFFCPSSFLPGPYFINATPGKYQLVITAVSTVKSAHVWSGDATSGFRQTLELPVGSIVNVDHTHGQIVLYAWDWYVDDNDPNSWVEVALYQLDKSSVSGRVIDTNNNPVVNVTISTHTGQTTTTDTNGSYTLTGLTAGTYTLTPSKPGYAFSPVSIKNITLPPDAPGQDFKATWTCPVSPLSPITDPLALSMENGNSLIWEPYTKPKLNAARDTFVHLVQQRGWSVIFSSAYRPLPYQQHLYEVWTKLHDLRILSPKCRDLRAQLSDEAKRHSLVNVLRPSPNGGHVMGIAFDATVKDEHGNILTSRGRLSDLDKLAAQAGLYRPITNIDPVHFKLINP
jgi:hypothetical protein